MPFRCPHSCAATYCGAHIYINIRILLLLLFYSLMWNRRTAQSKLHVEVTRRKKYSYRQASHPRKVSRSLRIEKILRKNPKTSRECEMDGDGYGRKAKPMQANCLRMKKKINKYKMRLKYIRAEQNIYMHYIIKLFMLKEKNIKFELGSNRKKKSMMNRMYIFCISLLLLSVCGGVYRWWTVFDWVNLWKKKYI